MVRLYRYNTQMHKWVFVGFGEKSKAETYANQGLVVVYY